MCESTCGCLGSFRVFEKTSKRGVSIGEQVTYLGLWAVSKHTGRQLSPDPTLALTLALVLKIYPSEKGTRFLSPPQHHEHLERILVGRLSQTTTGF